MFCLQKQTCLCYTRCMYNYVEHSYNRNEDKTCLRSVLTLEGEGKKGPVLKVSYSYFQKTKENCDCNLALVGHSYLLSLLDSTSSSGCHKTPFLLTANHFHN